MKDAHATVSGFARVFSAQPALPRAHIISVECDIARGLHAFSIVGLPDKSVEEAKDRIAAAIRNTNKLESPKRSNKKIVIALAPAALKKEGSLFDLAIALSFLKASGQLSCDLEKKMFLGELSLSGDLRPVRGVLSCVAAARDSGCTDVYVPEENLEEALLIPQMQVHSLTSLADAIVTLDGKRKKSPHSLIQKTKSNTEDDTALDDIRGQTAAKRALILAAAGAHNIAFYGPPGTGKTLLARAMTSILPDLTEEESLEVTAIHSFLGTLQGGVITRPPLRSPHHTSSYASLIGGGNSTPRPGEATLAHRGVLFCDEFPEFRRDVIQALREPLEERVISVARAKGSATFPANFTLIAAFNPCPCGFLGTTRCSCMPHAVEAYRRKMSGPIADRIDIWVQVEPINPSELSLRKERETHETCQARDSVFAARALQRARFKHESGIHTNADMRAKHIERYAMLTQNAEKTLQTAATRMKLSPRGYHRTIKLARTIADLSGETHVDERAVLEALGYRKHNEVF